MTLRTASQLVLAASCLVLAVGFGSHLTGFHVWDDRIRSTRIRSMDRAALIVVLVAACCVGSIALVSRVGAMDIWDDALMFSRYAENLARTGAVAWNPDGVPTWGLTSLAYLAPVALLRAVVPSLPAAWPVLASAASGAAFLVLLAGLVWRYVDPSRRLAAAALVTFTIALDARSSLHHWASGMDTTFALAWSTACLWALEAWSRRRTFACWPTVATAALVALTFLVRPDVLVLPCAIVAALVIAGTGTSTGTNRGRRSAWILAAASGILLVATWWAAFRYFGQPLPLPFFAKSTGLYDPSFGAAYAGVAWAQLRRFALYHAPLVALVAWTAVVVRRRLDAIDWGLLAGVSLFTAYHLTLVVPVMYFEARFFQPLLPPLLWFVLRHADELWKPPGVPTTRRHDGAIVGALVAALALLTFVGHGEVQRLRARAKAGQLGVFDLERIYHWRARHYWVGLPQVAALGEDLVIAATEVGAPGAMAPAATVFDMAGLHDPWVARHGFSADRLFAEQRPDLIYMPHPDYQGLHRALRGHPGIGDYELFERADLKSVLAVAIRRDSPYADSLHRIMEQRRGRVHPRAVVDHPSRGDDRGPPPGDKG